MDALCLFFEELCERWGWRHGIEHPSDNWDVMAEHRIARYRFQFRYSLLP